MSQLLVGLMSGTSLDGVDAALVDFSSLTGRIVGTHFLPYPVSVRREALALNTAGVNEVDRAWRLGLQLSALYARATLDLLERMALKPWQIRAIGCHGQTVRHRPDAGYTVQLVQGAALAETTDITVVTDFRSRDIAAGGQGAPLVPAFHQATFGHERINRIVANLGGIANVTSLPAQGTPSGFDTGPGNLLLDLWAETHLGRPRDDRGDWAASGRTDPDLLARMMSDAFLKQAPPRSTGRDHFNTQWLTRLEPGRLDAADVQATLAEFTAQSLAQAIRTWCDHTDEVLLCGGGVHNADLVRRITHALAPASVTSTARLGVDPDYVEACAFAWLALRTLENQPGNLPAVTGARGPRVLGAVYPAGGSQH